MKKVRSRLIGPSPSLTLSFFSFAGFWWRLLLWSAKTKRVGKKRIVTLSFYVYLSESLVSGRVDQDLRSATELEERADECVITHLANPTKNQSIQCQEKKKSTEGHELQSRKASVASGSGI